MLLRDLLQRPSIRPAFLIAIPSPAGCPPPRGSGATGVQVDSIAVVILPMNRYPARAVSLGPIV